MMAPRVGYDPTTSTSVAWRSNPIELSGYDGAACGSRNRLSALEGQHMADLSTLRVPAIHLCVRLSTWPTPAPMVSVTIVCSVCPGWSWRRPRLHGAKLPVVP